MVTWKAPFMPSNVNNALQSNGPGYVIDIIYLKYQLLLFKGLIGEPAKPSKLASNVT